MMMEYEFKNNKDRISFVDHLIDEIKDTDKFPDVYLDDCPVSIQYNYNYDVSDSIRYSVYIQKTLKNNYWLFKTYKYSISIFPDPESDGVDFLVPISKKRFKQIYDMTISHLREKQEKWVSKNLKTYHRDHNINDILEE